MMRAMLEGPRAELVGLNSSTKNVSFVNNAVYPNPSNGKVFFKTSNSDFVINIFDANGKFVAFLNNNNSLDFSNRSSGLYYFTMNQNGKLASGKFIIE